MIAAIALASLAQAVPDGGGDDGLTRRVADFFEQSCSRCHRPGSEEPKASRRWPDSLDLRATALDSDLVVPGDAEASALYLVLADSEMPPPSAGLSAPSEREIADVRAWIEAGAPSELEAAPLGVGSSSEGASRDATRAAWIPAALQGPLLGWMGRFHPILVHFPVALLTCAFVAELAARVLRRPKLVVAADFSLSLGAVAAVPAALLGLMHAANSRFAGAALDLHAALGGGAALVAPVVAVLALKRPALRIPLLAVMAAWIGLVGHTGGGLSFGADWLALPG